MGFVVGVEECVDDLAALRPEGLQGSRCSRKGASSQGGEQRTVRENDEVDCALVLRVSININK